MRAIKDLGRKSVARSTFRKIIAVRNSIRDLGTHLYRQSAYGRRLRSHCRGRQDLLLNLGCGLLVKPGWVNVDYAPSVDAFYLDILDGLPLADGTVRHIHCEHFLAYLDFGDAVEFLTECYRVIRPSGTMRVIVPDAERYMRAYCQNDDGFFAKLEHLGGAIEPLKPKNMVCNHSFRMGGDHRFAWDFETLDTAAKKSGFTASRSSINDVEAELRIDGQDWWRPFESLYVNLWK
jgi:hypothetical protein